MKNKKITVVLLATIIALLAVLNVFLWKENVENKKKISELKMQSEKQEEDYLTLNANLISLNDLNVHMSKELEMFRNKDIKTFIITSEEEYYENTQVIVCWNRNDHSLMISVEELPEMKGKKFYQLWSVVNGKYEKAAVFLQHMNGNFMKFDSKITESEGFILTIEEDFEKQAPSLDKPYLSGNPIIRK